MAAFDPTVQNVQNPGLPMMGSSPNILSQTGAGAALAHILTSFQVKRDTDARNRGAYFAHEHITASLVDIEKDKAINIIKPNFDVTHNDFVINRLEKAAKDNNYTPQNETERLAYASGITTYRQRETASSFTESMAAFKADSISMLMQNLARSSEKAVSSDPLIALEGRNEIGIAIESATHTGKGSIPTLSETQSIVLFTKTSRDNEIGSLTQNGSISQLIAIANDPTAAISLPVLESDGKWAGNYKRALLTGPEKTMMLEFKSKQEELKLRLEEGIVKTARQHTAAQKNRIESEVYARFMAPGSHAGVYDDLEPFMNVDGTPIFDGPERFKIHHDQQTFHATRSTRVKESDNDAFTRMYNRIYKRNPNGTYDTTHYTFPSAFEVISDKGLSETHASMFIAGINAKVEQRTDRMFTEYSTRENAGDKNIRSVLGGDNMLDINEASTYRADALNMYRSTMTKLFTEAKANNQSLDSIDGLLVSNKILEKLGPAYWNIIYANMDGQSKLLGHVIDSVKGNYSDTDDMSVLLTKINADVKRGTLDENVAIKMRMIVQNGIMRGISMGTLKEHVDNPFSLSIAEALPSDTTGKRAKSETESNERERNFWKRLYKKYGPE